MTAPLRVVIVGAGAQITRSHLLGLRSVDGEVVGVQDVDLAKAEQAAETIGCPAFADVDALLRLPADVAIVLTPHPFHAELAIACLRAGKHVLVEKPMADAVDRADAMVDEARSSGRLLAVALQHRTRAEVQAARQLIESGALGLLQRVDLIGYWPRRHTYFEVAPWRGTWRGEGGGVVVNQGQHDLDLLTYLAGLPRRLVAWTRTRMHQIETEDSAVAMLEWDDGALGSIHLATCEIDQPQRLELTGTNGRLRLLRGRVELVRNEQDMRDFVESPGPPFGTPPLMPTETITGSESFDHRAIYANLLDAIHGSAALIAPGDSAVNTLELANAIEYSSATNQPVTLPLNRTDYAEFLDSRRTL